MSRSVTRRPPTASVYCCSAHGYAPRPRALIQLLVPASMFHSLRRFTTAISLFGLLAAAIALTIGVPGRAEAHHLCGNTGSPFGPFDLQTYESADYRNAYARTMDLAGYNQLFPRPPYFFPTRARDGRPRRRLRPAHRRLYSAGAA